MIEFDKWDSAIIYYCKGWYETTDLISDLTKLWCKRCSVSIDYTSFVIEPIADEILKLLVRTGFFKYENRITGFILANLSPAFFTTRGEKESDLEAYYTNIIKQGSFLLFDLVMVDENGKDRFKLVPIEETLEVFKLKDYRQEKDR